MYFATDIYDTTDTVKRYIIKDGLCKKVVSLSER